MATELVEVPITGKIVEVNVKVGDKVSEGDVICILESMKMENPVVSPVDGTVKAIHVKSGQTVKGKDPVALIEY